MNPLKKLAGQTAVYGLSSIIGRFLNYLLVPLYTSQFAPEAYGVVTEFYAYVAFLIVLLTYGIETALFRFITREPNKDKVFSTALISLLSSTAVFVIVAILLSSPIATAMQYPDHPEYISWFALILALDAVTALPFAKLRVDNKATHFAIVKLANIGTNIGLNLFFLLLCKPAYESGGTDFLAQCYNPSIGIGYIFLSNLAASGITLLLLVPSFRTIKAGFDSELWQRMMRYALPLVVVGFAGIINETLDRALLKYLLPGTEEENLYQLGVYGACYKLAMLMSLFIQAFRYAAEPFFFSQADDKNSRQLYATVLNYFVIAGAIIFLVIGLYIDLFKHFIPNEKYWVGLHVVPILLLANLFLGVYVNLSIWYKLTDKTGLGAAVSIAGAVLTIILNIWLIPIYGYMGSAWATLATYVFLSAISWWLGRKYFPVPYHLGRFVVYILLAILVFRLDINYDENWMLHPYVFKAVLIMFYLLFVGAIEKQSSKNLQENDQK